MGDGIVLHLLNFSKLFDIAHSTFKSFIKFIPCVCRKVHLVYFRYAFIAHELFCQFDIAQMLINQVVEGINPRRYGYSTSAHREVNIRSTSLRWDNRLIASLILYARSEGMMSMAGYVFKILPLCRSVHAAFCAARTFHPHICKSRGITC